MGLFLPPAGIVQNLAFAASILQQVGLISNPDYGIAPQDGVWRPPQWNNGPAVYSITVQNPSLPSVPAPQPNSILEEIEPLPGAPGYQQTPTIYVFDAILRAEHRREIRLTQHPVQTGEAISDHSFIEPAEVILEVGMSDAMDSYSPGMWSGSATKSVSAYQTLISLMNARNFVTLTTRLNTYSNVVVQRVETPEDYTTAHGLRATVTFREVLMATVTAVSSGITYSAAPQVTNTTQAGSVLPAAVSQTITAQHSVANASSSVLAQLSKVSGAGNWSGINISTLSQLA